MLENGKNRCGWPGDDELMLRYHDEEWGVPVHNDNKWFEFIVLDAFQAGLSWKTVLHKREGFRNVFHGFDPIKVSMMTDNEINGALNNRAIIRNRLKINCTIKNASSFLRIQEKHGSFDKFIWSFTKGQVIHNKRKELSEIPAFTTLSDEVSRSLKSEGFSFVGTTICYSFLQAGGIVNDHIVQCYRHHELGGSSSS